ncbi:MAG: hypothetical protein D6743_00695, partial [Calditrichaeota bacterium]
RLQAEVEAVAREAGFEVTTFFSPDLPEFDLPPAILVLELEQRGAIDAVERWKAKWPDALLVGSVKFPVQELWHAAIAAGCDLVSNRGAVAIHLRKKLEAFRAGEALVKKAPRLEVRTNEREGDGQIGRLPDAPDGPIAVFRIAEKLCAFRDVCPHAGYALSDGDLEGKVLTCPAHGSQFNVCTGARLRGPSDFSIRIYRVVSEGDKLFVEL